MNKRIDDIEILRAFAVILVIIEHTKINLFTWVSPFDSVFYSHFSGWTGVDLFFAISGFVIARNLVPKLQACTGQEQFFHSTVTFWIRRFWRLVPSAWFWVFFILFCTTFFNTSSAWGTLENNFETALSALLQVANLHVALQYGKEFMGAALVYWSLSLEEQFYFLLPFIVLLSGRKLPWVLAVIVGAQLFLVRDTPMLALVRTDALFLGVLIAIWSQGNSYKLFQPHFLNSRVATGLLLTILLGTLACGGSDKIDIVEQQYGLVAIVSALLVLVASYDGNYLCRNPVLKAALLWVGTRSYALYLLHLPSFYLTREIWYRLEPAGTKFNTHYSYYDLFTALIILLLLSEFNYRFIETPFRKKGGQIALRRTQKKAVTAAV